MRRLLMGTAALAATLLLPMAAHTPMAQGTAALAPAARARVIVKYRSDSALLKKQALTATGMRILQTQALSDRIGIALAPGNGISDLSHVVFASGLSSKELAAKLAAQSDIEYAVPDERKHIVAVPNDSFYLTRPYDNPAAPAAGGPLVGQWYLKPQGTIGTAANTSPASINAEQAWDVTTGSASVVVAVIDTGVRRDHPDLQGGNVLPGYDMIGPDDPTATPLTYYTANDANGRHAGADDPGDWVSNSDLTNHPTVFANCIVENSSWHGTQTLGLIGAATNNGTGIASVGRNVTVLPVRVLGKCGGFDSDIAAGMLWAAGVHVPGVPDNANPAKVINMSLGGNQTCGQPYTDTVAQVIAQGAVIVVAAGNGDASGNGTTVGSPANCPGVLAVAALRAPGDKVGFSDLGPEIAISAPGGNCVNTGLGQPCLYPIMTTANAGSTVPIAGAAGAIYTDAFNASLGTSFSAPLVSGTVGLMLSVKSTLTPAEIKAKLQASAQAFPKTGGTAGIPQCADPATAGSQDECYCTTAVCGAGMLDAHAAVLAAQGVTPRISVTTPTPTAGQTVALTSNSVASSGVTIAAYQWAITNAGTTGATITGAANGSTVNVMPTAAGTFTISLTTTDNSHAQATTTSTVVVAAATVATPPPTPSAGGGAIDVGWLALLLAAVLALFAEARLQRRRAAALSAPLRSSSRRR